MRQWRKNGIPIDDEELCNLASRDGEALCEFGGVHFRFTAETVRSHSSKPIPSRGATVVLSLRQIDRPADPIYLVEFADAGLLDSTRCEVRQYGQLNDARRIAGRTARRYVCAELFRKAEGLIAGDQAA